MPQPSGRDKSVDINLDRGMSNEKCIPYEATHHIRDSCLCLHVQRAARSLARRFDEAFRSLELTNGQFSLLTSLNRPTPPTLSAVANLLAMDRTTLTAALKPLERRGLVKIRVGKEDKRSRLLLLTKAGKALLVKALPIWEREHAAVVRELKRSTDALRADLLTLGWAA